MDYPSNSYKARAARNAEIAEKKHVESVVTGTVKKKKKSELSKAKDNFILSDIKTVSSSCVKDILIPAAKNLIYDMVADGLNMLLYGETGGNRRRSRDRDSSYRRFFETTDDRKRSSRRSISRFDLDDVILSSKSEAEDVLDRMDDLIERYGIASVGDFKSLIGERSEHTDEKFGWTSFKSAGIMRIRDGRDEGYLIKVPKPSSID